MQFELEFGDGIAPTRKAEPTVDQKKQPAKAVVVTTSVQSDRKATPLERRFDKLWSQLEKKQTRQETFDKEVERARSWIRTELSQKRIEYKDELVRQTAKLISHLGKKSLARWQREVLGSWIEENFERLENYGATELPGLVRQYYTAKLTTLSKSDRAVIEDYYEESIEDILGTFDNDSAEEDDEDETIEGDDPDMAHDSQEQSRDHDNEYYQSEEKPAEESFAEKMRAAEAKKKRQTFDKSIVNKLFRRTAKALHPDHEQDEAIRDQKQSLMKTLLHARKTGNVAQIFKMYRQHVDSATIEIDLPDLKPMIDLLLQQIAELDELFFQKTRESAIHEWVGNKVMGKSVKGQVDAFAELKKDLEQDIKRVKRVFPYLGSLAKLKPLLEERYEMEMVGFY